MEKRKLFWIVGVIVLLILLLLLVLFSFNSSSPENVIDLSNLPAPSSIPSGVEG
jgi:uncharacterized integral membrane protein